MGTASVPETSIIIPNYNHARFLRRRIDSVLRQTFQDFELILLDDCSTDESRSILSSYAHDPRVRIEFNAANSGNTFKQWNKGVRLARGKYVWIAESDDYADERLLGRLVGVLEADEKVTYAYCRSWRVTEDDRLDGFADPPLNPSDLLRWSANFCADGAEECRNYIVLANPTANASAVVLRRAVFEQVGGADEKLRIASDWKLWAAMALHGRVAYVSEPLNYYRFHADSVRSKTLSGGLSTAELFRVVRWLMDQVEPADSVRNRFCECTCERWVSAVIGSGTPLRRRWSILRDVRAIDRRALRRGVRPVLSMIRLKIARHWHDLRAFAMERFANR